MVNQMIKRPQRSGRQQVYRSLVICEGLCEKLYFDSILAKEKYTIEPMKSSRSNAEKLVRYANSLYASKDNSERSYQKIYCVFDHDKTSNPAHQLQSANKIIQESNGKLVRVFSNPCFEIIMLFNFSKGHSKPFNSCKEVEAELSKKMTDELKKPFKYIKKDNEIRQISQLTNFDEICNKAKLVYDDLQVNENNWLNITDGYSEVFKLKL